MLRAYVQSVANEAGEKAEAIVESAGMTVKKRKTRTQQTVTNNGPSEWSTPVTILVH